MSLFTIFDSVHKVALRKPTSSDRELDVALFLRENASAIYLLPALSEVFRCDWHVRLNGLLRYS